MAEKTIDICTECRKKKKITIVDEVTRLCEDCLNFLDYIECDRCNEFWKADIVEFYETENGETICENCYEDEE